MKAGRFYATVTLKGLMDRATTPELERMHAAVHFYLTQFSAFKRKGLGPASVPGVHALVDRTLGESVRQGPPIACTKGCAHCCHIPLQATELEARRMVGAARKAGHVIDLARLHVQAFAPDFMDLTRAERACVMLKPDMTCAVYEDRPLACRKYLVSGDPDLCDVDKHPGGKVGIVNSEHVECIASAYGTVFTALPLPVVLEKVL